jgi:two-component system phosphate regulon sensor histidine kinase PhoR
MCEIKASARSVKIDYQCDPELQASMNAPLLEQALVNLLDNSIKYSDEGTPVRVVGEVDGDQILISVQDHGRGISEQHLARIFERFYRVDQARSRKLGGTGLGLAIVKHIAIAHRGKVSVKSKPGEGSTFTISLPRTAAVPAEKS